jgi:hypothetical protein
VVCEREWREQGGGGGRWRVGPAAQCRQCGFKPIQIGSNRFKFVQTLTDLKGVFPCSKKLKQNMAGKSLRWRTTLLKDFPQIQNGFGTKIQRTSMSWISIENLLGILETLDFNEIRPASSLLHLIARKNKFPSKEDQKVEFHWKWEIQLISR